MEDKCRETETWQKPRETRRLALTYGAASDAASSVYGGSRPYSRRGNPLPSRVIRVRRCAEIRWVTRAVRIAFLEVGTQLVIGQMFPVLRFRNELAAFSRVVRRLLTAQRTHRAQTPDFVHCNLPVPLIHNVISFFVGVETTFLPQTFFLLITS